MSDAPIDEQDLDATRETTITVPAVSGEEVAQATDLIEELAGRYGISDADLNVLFNAFVAVFVRNRIVYAEGQAPPCDCAPTDDGGSSFGGGGLCC